MFLPKSVLKTPLMDMDFFSAAALGLGEFLVGYLDLAAPFVEELCKGLFANHWCLLVRWR
ncbi:hypothetical protein GCM10017771_91490 [Streptomyces capitiformicae]|uniref:Uncharacterized protein n=1 Tax=Streptomyces capitiformicae TaxID=2014920 RepID=A0A919DR43_9ACTN|nr:hypothetical protein GCM10017771_91490 [Streptomyces capitiformicae]